MPLNIHKEHFQGLVDKNKELRRTLINAAKAKINGDWCIIEAVPFDEEMVYCYNEETKAQAELGVFKDYRKLMKAVDVRKKQGPFGGGSIGGLSIEGGVPNDFSTID